MLEREIFEGQEMRNGGTGFSQVRRDSQEPRDKRVVYADQLYARQEAAGVLQPEIPLRIRFAPKAG